MKNRKKRLLIVAGLLLIISSIFLIKEIVFIKKALEVLNISVVTRGGNEEVYARVRQGIDRAAEERFVNIKFINLKEKNNIEEQKVIIRNEISNDVDGILVFPIEYESIKEILKESKKKVPIICLESQILNRKIPYVSNDNYQIGYKIADEVMSRGNTKSRILVLENLENVNVMEERKDGFLDSMKLTQNTVDFQKIDEKNKNLEASIKKVFEVGSIDVVVTFDVEILEILAKIKENYFKDSNIEIYGVGTTNFIISSLEKKIVNGFVLQSDFNMGYLGIKRVVELINSKKIENEIIDTSVVNLENMYLDHNQRILFPFI